LEAESETSDFFIVVSGIVRAVMRFSFEEVGSKSILESDSAPSTKFAQKVRNPTELAICKLGTQNTFGEFYVGRKAKSPVAFVADSSQVRLFETSTDHLFYNLNLPSIEHTCL
jgi:hypothetical protein